jgi:hypothetical protein
MASSGAKKDLMVLSFCKSMIEVSQKEESVADANLHSRDDNKDYKVNKRIDRALERLSEKMTSAINAIYKEGGSEVATWVRNNLHKRVGGTLTKIQEEQIDLEMLALWVMYCNFAEKKRPLHKEFEQFVDANQYFNITELMTNTKVANLEEAMFNTAYDVIAKLKG